MIDLLKILGCRDFLKFILGKDNTRKISQNYFETIKYTLSEHRHFVLKKYQSSLLLRKKVMVRLTEISASHPNIFARYSIFLPRK